MDSKINSSEKVFYYTESLKSKEKVFCDKEKNSFQNYATFTLGEPSNSSRNTSYESVNQMN